MIKTRKDLFRLLLTAVILACYVFCFTVPYLQTFGQSYSYSGNFYADYFGHGEQLDYPDHRLTLDGMVLRNRLGQYDQTSISNAICRIPLTKLNFDNLFKKSMWTHRYIDAKWLRENCKAAWLGFCYNWIYNRVSLQYILKLNNGDVVVCQGSPSWYGIRELGSAEFFSPCGNIWEFYQHIEITD